MCDVRTVVFGMRIGMCAGADARAGAGAVAGAVVGGLAVQYALFVAPRAPAAGRPICAMQS